MRLTPMPLSHVLSLISIGLRLKLPQFVRCLCLWDAGRYHLSALKPHHTGWIIVEA